MNLGLELALTGMGTVFLFLVLLVIATTVMSWLVKRLEESPSAVDKAETQPAQVINNSADQGAMSPELLTTIISAAIHKHRSGNRK